MEDPFKFINQENQIIDSLDEFLNFQSLYSHESNTTSLISIPTIDESPICNSVHPEFPVIEKPSNPLKSSKASSSSSSRIISFANSDFSPKNEAAGSDGYLSFNSSDETQSYAPKYEQEVMIKTKVGSSSRSSPHSQEHVIAERKRREKLAQRFIALSAVIPDLKKIDKASILGGAIKYVKHLEERVKMLEDQTLQKTKETVVFTKRSSSDQLSTANHDEGLVSSPDDHDIKFYSCSNQPLPEIAARISNKDVLIRIHCEKQKGSYLANILGEIEKLHLTVVNSSVFPLGSFTIDITVVAQMDVGFCMDAKDLEKSLRETLLKYSSRIAELANRL